VVATPIGNRRDLSPRAAQVLAGADVIAAEDTRHIQRLGETVGGLSGQRLALYSAKEDERIPAILERLRDGASVALVSDAGTPAVSDPGGRLVAAAHAEGLPVRAIPGPSAVTALLSAAGLPADHFCFRGFLPTQAKARTEALRDLARQEATTVVFESPRRVADLLAGLAEHCGDEREAAVGRELTKRHEAVHRGPLADLAAHFAEHTGEQRGELVVAVAGRPAAEAGDEGISADTDRLLEALLGELPVSRAAKVAARASGGDRRTLYQRALALADDT
jgi:16S rRNA (cytidine1402-2'-O)-methyltransferase